MYFSVLHAALFVSSFELTSANIDLSIHTATDKLSSAVFIIWYCVNIFFYYYQMYIYRIYLDLNEPSFVKENEWRFSSRPHLDYLELEWIYHEQSQIFLDMLFWFVYHYYIRIIHWWEKKGKFIVLTIWMWSNKFGTYWV